MSTLGRNPGESPFGSEPPSSLEAELALRLDAMNWLSSFEPDHLFTFPELADFRFRGERIALMDRQRGIRKPAHLVAALAIRTVFTPPQQEPPYEDETGADGLLRYKYRGTDPSHPENKALRRALELRLPMLWFVGVASGIYLARYPVYIAREEPRDHQFVVALDEWQRSNSIEESVLGVMEDSRAYAERITNSRLHQPLFRARVLEAYKNRCAICRLPRASLLDASHILSDTHKAGLPVVPNGLALCKIHHASYDQNLIGIRPDLTLEVSKEILQLDDGPILRYGLQELRGKSITVPQRRDSHPDPERLAIRFQEFAKL